MQEKSHCYTYEVTMTIHVLAQNQEQADEKLDVEGGYVSSRNVTLKSSIELNNE